MFRMMVMNGVLISLICIWTSAARESSAGRLITSPLELPKGPLTHSLPEPRVSLNDNPMESRRRRNTCRRELDGKCVRNNRKCPGHLPSGTSSGKPYCSKRRRCCYQETTCKFRSLQEHQEYAKLWPGRCPEVDETCQLDWVRASDGGFRPLILDNSPLKGFPKIILPLPNPGISVKSGTPLVFACSGKDNSDQLIKFKNEKLKNEHAVYATCEKGEIIIYIDGIKDNYRIKNMGCVDKITSDIIKKIDPDNPLQQKQCGPQQIGDWWQIAFDYNTNEQLDKFYPQIDVCFEKREMTTIWSQHTMYGESLHTRVANSGSKTFLQTGDFFDSIPMGVIYNWEQEQKILGELIESNLISFNKGHLSPNGDFVTGAEQVATYNYINALPQWQPYNGANWKITELKILVLAKTNNAILSIITGGAGIINKEDDSKVFLAQSLTEPSDKVPIPYYFWKVVVAEKEGKTKAVAFVMNNNPLVPEPPKALHPCEQDICSKLTEWINPNHIKNMKIPGKGYTFCCEVNELKREVVPNAPTIEGAVLLENLKWD